MTIKERKFAFDTLLIHGGLEAGPGGATTVPIVQSSSFAHETAEDLEDVFRGRKVGQVYTPPCYRPQTRRSSTPSIVKERRS